MPRDWEDFVAKEVRTVVKTSGTKEKCSWMYAGELRRIHGDAEFEHFAAKGKWETREDEDGDVQYRKKEKVEVSNSMKHDSASAGKSMAIDSGAFQKLYDAMGQNKSFLSLADTVVPKTKAGKNKAQLEPKSDHEICLDKIKAMLKVGSHA